MKSLVVFLSIACVALIGLVVVRSRSANAQLQVAQTDAHSLSNRLTEAEMKVNHQERMNAALGSNLTNRTDELAKRDADLARVRADLAQSRKETPAARNEVAAALTKVEELKAELESLTKQLADANAESRASDKSSQEVREQLSAIQAERVSLSQQLAAMQETITRLNNLLNNPDFLRVQLAELRNQPSSVAPNQHKPDLRLPIELLANGSIRSIPPATNSLSKP